MAIHTSITGCGQPARHFAGLESSPIHHPSRRLPMFDALKGFAILLVVYTHVLQYSGIGEYFSNPAFKFSYSFHMPLFMTISGYFAASSIQLPFFTLLKRKSMRLLLPCVSAVVVVLLLNLWLKYIPRSAYVSYFIGNLWYLKALFICYVVAWSSLRIAHSLTAAIAGSILLSSFLPGPFYWPFVLPFFWLGYIWQRHPEWLNVHKRLIGISAFAVFCILWVFWDGELTVYRSALKLIDYKHLAWKGENLGPHLLRLAIGTAGTLTTLAVFSFFYQRGSRLSHIEYLGKYTLEIYTLNFMLIHTGMFRFIEIPYHKGIYELLYCPAVSVPVFAICIIAVRLMARNRWLNGVFLGNWEIRARKVRE